MISVTRSITATFFAVSLTACGASSLPSGRTFPTPSSAASSRTKGVAAFVISDYFPKGNARRPRYFPGETQALLIRIGRHQTKIQLTPLSPQCHLGPTSIKCVVKVTTSRGRSPYTVTALDEYNRRLSTASGSANVGAQTNIPLALHGIPEKSTVALEATPTVGRRSSIGLAFSAYDADGALIVGSAPYDKPLRLGDSDKTGAFKLNTPTVAGPKTRVSLAYDGAVADTTAFVAALLDG